jgi:hypothetical protein
MLEALFSTDFIRLAKVVLDKELLMAINLSRGNTWLTVQCYFSGKSRTILSACGNQPAK